MSPFSKKRETPPSPPLQSSIEATGAGSVSVGGDVQGIIQTAPGSNAWLLSFPNLATPDSVNPRPGLNSLPIRTNLFVGRGSELDQLDTQQGEYQSAAVAVVHGLGGIGKSTLAAHWAARREHGCYPVRWISSETPSSIQLGLASLAVDLEPSLAALISMEYQAQWAVQWLAAHSGWLLILDNVDSIADIEPLLTRATAGRYLITSRLSAGWRGINPVILDVLSPVESMELAAKILAPSGSRDLNGLDILCAELGHLPLAIDQVASYLAQNPLTTPLEYLELLKRYPGEIYQQSAENSSGSRTISRIWRITMDRIAAKQPLAADLLRALAWYAAGPIPATIPEALLDGEADPRQINSALSLLLAYSMIRVDTNSKTYSVHRLVQSFFREPDAGDPHRTSELISEARDLALHLHSALPQEFDENADETWGSILPHLEILFDLGMKETYHGLFQLNKAGLYLCQKGRPRLAVKYLEAAVSGASELYGESDAHTLSYAHNLADAYAMAGEFSIAIPLYRKTIEGREAVLGADDSETLTTRYNLVIAFSQSGDYARAIPSLEDILEKKEASLGCDHESTLGTLHDLGCTYRDSGDSERAVELLEDALERAQDQLGPEHPRTLTFKHNLATLYADTGNTDRAITMLSELLEMAIRVHGEESQSVMLAKNSLGLTYGNSKNFDRAVPLLQSASDIGGRVLEDGHPYIAIIRNNLNSAISALSK